MESMKNKGLGALPNIDSIRIYDYSAIAKEIPASAADSNVTDYKIPEDIMPRVFDQGNVGSCVANAICAVLETFYYRETGKKIELSTGWFYGHNRSDYSNSIGMVTSSAIEYTKEFGSVPTTIFNDYGEMPGMKEIVKQRPDLEEYAKDTRIKSFVTFNKADKKRRWQDVKEAFLAYNLPMVAVSNDYFRGGSHCIMLYGFNENGETGKEFYFQNSWGENYGDHGRSTIPYDKLDAIYLLLDEEITLRFDDVPEDAWYYKNVLHLYSAGLISGKTDTKFAPEDPITRAEVCAMIDRLMERIERKDDAMMKSVYDYVDRHDEIIRG